MQDALTFIVKTLLELYIITFFLRFILQWVRADFRNPISQFLVRVTNPLIIPIRRLIPSIGGLDTATIMIIESAERFGLSQLHQLRGRVGRGRAESSCVAIHGELSENGARRLDVFGSTTAGFRIAEADLDIRGPGDLLGTRQAGLPTFRVANIVADREWLERARADARELLADPADLEAEELVARVAPRAADRYERFAGG